MDSSFRSSERRVVALELATAQGSVASRRQLYALAVTRWEIRAEVRGGRWQLIGDQSVHLANGELGEVGLRWAAVFQGGPRACLDGSSALVASGLKYYAEDRLRVSVPRGARVRRTPRFDIRQTRRWSADDVVASGIPRTPGRRCGRSGRSVGTHRQAGGAAAHADRAAGPGAGGGCGR